MSEEEKKAIDYFKEKIKNKLPLYEETYIDGKPYRRNILQLETNFTEEQANKAETLLNLIEKQQEELNKEKEKNKLLIQGKFREVADKNSYIKDNYIHKDKIREKIEDEQKECFLYKNGTKCEECMERCEVEGFKELLEESE